MAAHLALLITTYERCPILKLHTTKRERALEALNDISLLVTLSASHQRNEVLKKK